MRTSHAVLGFAILSLATIPSLTGAEDVRPADLVLSVWEITDASGDVIVTWGGPEQPIPNTPAGQRDYVDLVELGIDEPNEDTIRFNLTNVGGFEPGQPPSVTFFRALHVISFKLPGAMTFANIVTYSYQPAQGVDAPLIVERVYLCPSTGREGVCVGPQQANLTATGGDFLLINVPKSFLTRSFNERGLNQELSEGTETWPIRLNPGSQLNTIEAHARANQILITGDGGRADPTALHLIDRMPDDASTESYALAPAPAGSPPQRPVLSRHSVVASDDATPALSALALLAAIVGVAVLRAKR